MTELEIAIKTLMEHTQYYVPVEDLEALYVVIDMAKKLEEYKTAEEEGRLVSLPCNTVYFIWNKSSGISHVRSKSVLDMYLYEILGIDNDGKYWSTRERAEEVLQKEF